MSNNNIDSILLVDFAKRGTEFSGSAPEKIKNERVGNFKKWLNDGDIKFADIYERMTWELILNNKNYEFRHHITINMDWKHHQKDDDQQREILKKILHEYHKYIKNILCIYEYGKHGKMHFHMLLYTSRIRQLEKDLTIGFGHINNIGRNTNYAVRVKPIKCNKNQTWNDNIEQIINYFKKEDHNKKSCWITKKNI